MAATALLLGSTLARSAAAQVCECRFPESNENGRVAGALGGGMFAGLLAAVLHVKHQREAAGAPSVGPVGPGASADAAPPIAPAVVAAIDPAPAERNDPWRREGELTGTDAPARAAHTVRPEPMLSSNEARREGLIPPKTATLYPALAMIGVGSLLLGLFMLRERSGRRRWR
jgi:hypothetical protein